MLQVHFNCRVFCRKPEATFRENALTRVDGFDQDEAAGEGDEGAVVPGGLFAAKGDAFESLELSEGLLDAGAGLVERLGEEGGLVLGIRAIRDDRADAAIAGGLPVGLGIPRGPAGGRPEGRLRPCR